MTLPGTLLRRSHRKDSSPPGFSDSDKPKIFYVEVRTLTGGIYTYTATADSTTDDLKAWYCRDSGVPRDQCYFVHRGRVVEVGELLGQLQAHLYYQFSAVLKLRGC